MKIGEMDIPVDTLLSDFKPYMPKFDIRNEVLKGWYKDADNWKEYEIRKGVPPRL